MIRTERSPHRAFLLLLGVFASSFLLAAAAVLLAGPLFPTHDTESPGGKGDVLHWRGEIRGATLQNLISATSLGGWTLIVGIDAEDTRSCEDLGRQLRRVAAAIRPEDRVLVLYESESRYAVEAFFREEGIPWHLLLPYEAEESELVLIGEDASPPTPFVSVVPNQDARIADGVSFLGRVIGVRGDSFVARLAALRTESAYRAPKTRNVGNP